MARRLFDGPRKRRTRRHVIADLSVHHVEGFVLEEGHTVERLERDYGYDLVLFTFDEQGYAEPGCVLPQLKASESFAVVGSDHVFDLDVRDYNLWMGEESPVILVLFDATRRCAVWLHVQGYFRREEVHRPRRGVKTVRVRIPVRQRLGRRAVRVMRGLKAPALRLERGDRP